MSLGNGKTQKVGGRLNTSSCEDKSERLGVFRDSSELNGVESVGVDQANSSRSSSSWGISAERNSSNGKILERLDLIEGAFLSYVRSHQERLQVRLEESKKQEESFLGVISHLKQDIYDFVSNDENNNSSD